MGNITMKLDLELILPPGISGKVKKRFAWKSQAFDNSAPIGKFVKKNL
jgi:hypothetical protein